MAPPSQPLAFSSGFHNRSPACGRAVSQSKVTSDLRNLSHSKVRTSHLRHRPTAVATLPATEVEDGQPEAAHHAQGKAAELVGPEVSRLNIPFVGSGRTGTLAVRQRILQDYLKDLGREKNWEKVCELMTPADKGIPASSGIYSSAIVAVAKSRRGMLALELEQRAQAEGFATDSATLSCLLTSLGNCGLWKEGCQLIRRMRAAGQEPTLWGVNAVLDALRKAKKADISLQLMEQLRSTPDGPDAFSFRTVISTCASAGRWQLCLDMMQEMRDRGISTATVDRHLVIIACGTSGAWRSAVRVVEDMQADGLQIDSYSYTAVVSTCGRAGQWEKAAQYLEDMEAAGIKIRIESYNAVLSSYTHNGELQRALSLLKDMKEKGVALDFVSYNLAISACSKAKDLVKMMSFFLEMKDRGIKRDSFTYTGLITAFGRAGNWKMAVSLLMSMESDKVEPNEFSYGAAFSGLAMAGNIKSATAARELLGRMQDRGIMGNDVCYGKAIAACGNGGLWEDAIEIFNGLEGRGVMRGPHCYEAALEACSRASKWERAMDIFNQARDKFGKNKTVLTPMFRAVLLTCIQSNQWGVAKGFLDMMETTGCPVDQRLLTAALEASAKAKTSESTVGLLDIVRAKHVEVNIVTYNVGMVALGKFGLWAMALEILHEIRHMAVTITYNSVLHALSRAGEWEQAIVLFDRMKEERRVQLDVVSYTTLMGAFARSGEWKRALDLLTIMPSEGVDPNRYTYGAAITACAQAGKPEEVLNLINTMASQGIPLTERRVRSTLKTADAAEAWEVSLAVLDKAERDDGVVPLKWSPDRAMYGIVFKTCLAAGQSQEAFSVLKRMHAAGLQAGEADLNTILLVWAMKGSWDQAEETLSMMRGGSQRRVVKVELSPELTPLIREYCQKQQWERLRDLVSWMATQNLTPDVNMLRTVQDAFRRTPHWREAQKLSW